MAEDFFKRFDAGDAAPPPALAAAPAAARRGAQAAAAATPAARWCGDPRRPCLRWVWAAGVAVAAGLVFWLAR